MGGFLTHQVFLPVYMWSTELPDFCSLSNGFSVLTVQVDGLALSLTVSQGKPIPSNESVTSLIDQ